MALVLLGVAWTFAIFAGTTITNVPNVGTYLSGDIGTFPGSAIEGFPPGVVYGNTYSAGPAGMVVGDILIAYNNATGQAANHILTDTDLGGLTLSPGVYKFDGAAALSAGQLFLDAHGDKDAVWIFQIATSFNVASGTSMFFTSGLGNANNVFWAVGSSATLKEDVNFIGNVLAYAAISCDARVTVNGRLLAVNGAVTLSQTVVSFPEESTFSISTLSVDPTRAPSAAPTEKRSQSDTGKSHSKAIVAGVLGGIAGLIVGSVVGAVVYLVAPHFSGGSSVGVPQKDLPMQEMNLRVPNPQVV
jgi:hypothetical protein